MTIPRTARTAAAGSLAKNVIDIRKILTTRVICSMHRDRAGRDDVPIPRE